MQNGALKYSGLSKVQTKIPTAPISFSSFATKLGGDMTMFQTRVYNYDKNLLYLAPPWFPTLQDTYTTLLFRELAPGSA